MTTTSIICNQLIALPFLHLVLIVYLERLEKKALKKTQLCLVFHGSDGETQLRKCRCSNVPRVQLGLHNLILWLKIAREIRKKVSVRVFWLSSIPLCICTALLYSCLCLWTLRSIPCPGYCRVPQYCRVLPCSWQYMCFFNYDFLRVYAQQWDCWFIW